MSDSLHINKPNLLNKLMNNVDKTHLINQKYIEPINKDDKNDIFNPFLNSNSLFISHEDIDTTVNICKEPLETTHKPFFIKSVSEIINDIKNSGVAHAETLDNCHVVKNKIPIHPINEYHNHINNFIHNINFISNFDHKDAISKPIIKFSSSLLPAMDGIAHHVLTLNQNFINYVLDNDAFPLEIQKKLVLFSIQAAQNGDNMGSAILEFYYKLVDHLI